MTRTPLAAALGAALFALLGSTPATADDGITGADVKRHVDFLAAGGDEDDGGAIAFGHELPAAAVAATSVA